MDRNDEEYEIVEDKSEQTLPNCGRVDIFVMVPRKKIQNKMTGKNTKCQKSECARYKRFIDRM